MNKLVLLASLLVSANVLAAQIVYPGQSVTAYEKGEVITCVNSAPPAPPVTPPPPPPPPKPVCNATSLENSIAGLENAFADLVNGNCYRGYGVRRCGGRIEEHAIGDVKNAFFNHMTNVKNALNDFCGDREQEYICGRRFNYVIDRHSDLIQKIESAKITYFNRGVETKESFPSTANAYPFCGRRGGRR